MFLPNHRLLQVQHCQAAELKHCNKQNKKQDKGTLREDLLISLFSLCIKVTSQPLDGIQTNKINAQGCSKLKSCTALGLLLYGQSVSDAHFQYSYTISEVKPRYFYYNAEVHLLKIITFTHKISCFLNVYRLQDTEEREKKQYSQHI